MFQLPRDGTAVATFIKTDSPVVVEILALSDLDFVVLDAEHAPFDRGAMDRMLFTARALGLPMLVRVPDHRDATILSALDLGAAGIVVPHVDSAADAHNVVGAARFIGGRRGISLSARFGGFGTISRAEAIADADRSAVICQIESAAAVDAVEAIAAVPGVGGLLIGRSDLALSLGVDSPSAPAVMDAVERIVAAAKPQALSVVLVCANTTEAAEFAQSGANAFVIGSDQSLLRSAALQIRAITRR
ncbi:HpcH/HpaI aldolase family protein [Caballeronia sp. DA-9]|uniref:HpcH/HpaI aldolase family protein n=1 Tax=Caballeronia sp. DA-9 TaxID=3436237 RepID=UPI003F67D48B